MSEKKEEILIVKMYVGDFNNENIGHEIINFFKTDDGEEYIYVPAYGGIGKGHYKNINHIIFTTGIEDNKLKILAKAEIDREDEVINEIQIEKEYGDENINDKQKKIIDRKNITYGKQKLYNIMQYNQGSDKAIYITYKVKKILKSQKDIYICNASYKKEHIEEVKKDPQKYIILKDKVNGKDKERQIPKQKMYAIINQKEEPNNYESMLKLLKNNNNWEKEDMTKKVNIKKYSKESNINFLHMCQKENEEQIYTNMLFYWFTRKINDKSLFELFLTEFNKNNKINKIPIDNYFLSKESKSGSGRMDMLAQGTKNIIIVENKIKAELHHIDKTNKTTQLSKYIDDVEKGKYKKSNKKDNKQQSEKIEKRMIHGIIFIPNYNFFKIQNEIKKLEKNYENILKVYRIITYNDLYLFFEKYINDSKLKNDLFYKYYKDFLNALYNQHYDNFNDKLKEDIEIKFVNVIRMLNEKK